MYLYSQSILCDLLDLVWRFDGHTAKHMPNTLYVNSAIQCNGTFNTILTILSNFIDFVCFCNLCLYFVLPQPRLRSQIRPGPFDLEGWPGARDSQKAGSPEEAVLTETHGLDCIGFKADCAIPKTFFIHLSSYSSCSRQPRLLSDVCSSTSLALVIHLRIVTIMYSI